MVFEWKENFSVNNKDIDEQHKKLFEIGQRLYDLISSSGDYDRFDEIMAILDELSEYVKYHFEFEEKLMEECQYSNLAPHKMEHYFFMKKINKEKERDIDSSQKETLLRLVKFVADWIMQHILKEDMAYKEHLELKLK
jgi:hemerythrin